MKEIWLTIRDIFISLAALSSSLQLFLNHFMSDVVDEVVAKSCVKKEDVRKHSLFNGLFAESVVVVVFVWDGNLSNGGRRVLIVASLVNVITFSTSN